jgi:serine/threonine-protein kinase
MSDKAQRVAELVKSALECQPDERAAFLADACAGDPELRAEVDSFLQFQPAASEFIEQGALHVAAQIAAREAGTPGLHHLEGYEIISRIGVGGMGEVYLAKDTKLRRHVALKLVRAGMDTSEIVARFRQEEQILASLNHPNIAQLYGAGVAGGDVPFLAMEYIEGVRIDEYCNHQAPSTTARLQLFRKVCAAVLYAHQRLIIHRDLKPSNILVTAEGEPKLLDFGIAKLLEGQDVFTKMQTTLPGAMTPDYASPEQVRGEAMTTATDVYSLGVLLYEILTGQRPYRLKTRSPDEIARAITDQAPERPSTAIAKGDGNSKFEIRDSKFPKGDLDNIVLMALRKEPSRRYASVGQLSEDIRRYLEGLPVVAHKDTVSYRAAKFIKRNKIGVAAAVVIMLTLLSGVVATLRQAQVARQERDKAKLAQATAERLNQFLQSLLGSANPDGMGRDVKVVQVLEAAAARLDRDLGSEPKLLAQAHLTIARAYAQLRIAEPAEAHARAALAINQRIFGDEHPATAQVMAFLGQALKIFRRYDEAEPLLRQAVTVHRRFPPADRNELATMFLDLGAVLTATGRAQEALPLIEEALALSRELNGEESVQVADALNNLGNLRAALNDPAATEAAYRASIDIHRRLKPIRLTFLNPLHNLCAMLLPQGKIDEVEALLREGETFCRESIGENNPTYGYLLGRLGFLDFLKGNYDAAIPKLQRCLGTVGLVYPKTDRDMVLAKSVLGLALTRDGRAAEAEHYLREALAEGKGIPRAELAPIGNLESALGECLLAQQKYAEAEPVLAAAYEELRSRNGDADSHTTQARARLREALAAAATE